MRIAICLAGIAAVALAATLDAQGRLRSRVYASGFNAPVAFVQDPTDRTVQYVVEQAGRIRVVRSGTVMARDFLDLTPVVLSGGERGLLGMAFAPDSAASGRFFVNFTTRTVSSLLMLWDGQQLVDASAGYDSAGSGGDEPFSPPDPPRGFADNEALVAQLLGICPFRRFDPHSLISRHIGHVVFLPDEKFHHAS